MTLLIDNREPKHLVEELLAQIPDAKVEQLAYGDFIVLGTDKKFVIERKSMPDLFASLEGRLWDQLKGIEKNFEGYKRILLVEGSIWQAQKWNPRITLARYTGIKTSLIYGWNEISLVETQNQTETIDFLKRLVIKAGSGKPEDYARSLGFTKDARTPNEELEDMLRGIDGVGSMKSKELLTKFKSITHLSKANVQELTQVLGEHDAEHVYDVLRRRYSLKKVKKVQEVANGAVEGQS